MKLKYFIYITAIILFLNNIPLKAKEDTDKPPVPAEIKTTQPASLIDEPVPETAVTVSYDMPEPFKQGSSVIVYVETKKSLENPQISFAGVTSRLYPVSETKYRAITGIDAVAKPGGYTLKVFDDNGLLSSKVIEVESGHFPIQNIRISGSKASLEATEEELKKVADAKATVSNKSYWSSKPFVIPTTGCIISPYGRTRYHNGKPTGDFHKGIDIKAPTGRPIVSLADGKVLIAEDFRLHGKTVSVDHGQGLMSIYIHMSGINVKEGDIVKQGQKLGVVGSTGFATGPHLHFGLYTNGVPVNPMEWIKPISRCR